MTSLLETSNKNGRVNPSVSSNELLSAVPSAGYVSPVVTRERFAEMVGLPLGVVIGWCNKGLIPTLTIGKYSLISVELLRKRCLEKEFS
jgi:hypothetical protein